MKKIVSVQDISCYGQCSLTVALPIVSAYGIETAILPSAILSTHTSGFQNFTVLDLTDEMPKIVNHWKDEKIKFDAIYTGYIGDARQFDIVKDMRSLLNKDGLLIVDPAMADNGKLYPALNQDIVAGMKTIVSIADYILPNLTEAAFLLGEEYKESYSKADIEKMVKDLADLGAKNVIITGVSYEEGKIGAVAYNKETGEFKEYFADKQAKSYHGTGDVFSSVIVANIVNGASLEDTLKDACEFVVKSIQETVSDDAHGYGVKFEQVLANK